MAQVSFLRLLLILQYFNFQLSLQLRVKQKGCNFSAVGIASFGPIDARRGSNTFGYITTTPKVLDTVKDSKYAVTLARIIP